jgi:hypothetical protein
MEQHHSPEPEHIFARNPIPEQTLSQAKIEAYLDRICSPLAGTLSADEAAEQRAEMRTHLEALVTAHLELGHTEAEAVKVSLDQFGRKSRLQDAWRNCRPQGIYQMQQHASQSSEMLGGSTVAFCVNFVGCGVLGAGVARRRQKRAMRLARSK